MAWIRTEVTITEEPQLRYNADGLAICTLFEDCVKYVAFDELAEDIAEWVKVGDSIRLWGYYKQFGAREDFIVRKWERIA